MTVAKRPGLAARLYDRATARQQRLPKARCDIRVEHGLAVPARDGVTLVTDHYFPVGQQGRGTVLIRTPYGRGLPINADARLFAGQGYHVVVQSCRGTFGSGGRFMGLANEMDDGQDAVAWLRRQRWFDGRLATYGASAVGWTQWALLMDPPPELRTSIIIAGMHDVGRFAWPAGAMRVYDLLTWARAIGVQERFGVLGVLTVFSLAARLNAPTLAGLPFAAAAERSLRNRAPWFGEMLSHPDLSDPFWEPYNACAALEKVQVPVRLVAGWQDVMLPQTMRQYAVLRERGLDVSLTVGPWIHQVTVVGGNGELAGENLDWLAEHLAGAPVTRRRQAVRIQVTGTGEWREHAAWPPPGTEQVHFLHPGGLLTERQVPQGDSSFVYDPGDPTPTVGGPLLDRSAGVHDNRSLEQRADVLTFTTAPIVDELEIIGTPVVELDHVTDNPHADLFVRLCDVDPKGRSHNFTEAFLRLEPTENGPVRLELDPCAHRLAPGHRLRLQVSGGSFPHYLRNEGTGAQPGTGVRLAPCTHTVHHGRSRVILPVAQPVAGP
ncbi:CocE/NonD family hydrolase [Micromonospora wenchangensis]|uniref:CocE/NonD family hydrolase n=1 Tax=Micromonospora wenchangensis TaxID=1185415 RepID=UPI0033DFB405